MHCQAGHGMLDALPQDLGLLELHWRAGGDGPSPDMFWASSSLMASSVLASSFSSLAMSQVWSPAALAATLVPSTA